jgi:hypothetical protein
MMENQEFRALLEKLHQEIEGTETVDEKGQQLLGELETDIRDLLERSHGAAAQPAPTMLQSLEDSIAHLEVTHPTLTSTLAQLLAVLSNAGI